MADVLDTIQKLINSPPGQLAAGGVLGGITWKFFKNVGDALNEKTNREIAHWIKVKHFESGLVADYAVGWPVTFAKIFDRVFGTRHLSWKCFYRSCVLSLIVSFCICLAQFWEGPETLVSYPLLSSLAVTIPLVNFVPDYLSLLQTRLFIFLMGRTKRPLAWLVLLVGDFAFNAVIGFVAASALAFAAVSVETDLLKGSLSAATAQDFLGDVMKAFQNPDLMLLRFRLGYEQGTGGVSATKPFFYPVFFTSIWLWLYAGSGFLLKAARRFDIGFDWFNRKFDIEKKPLQSIGLVAGALVSMVYWVAVIVSRLL